MEFKVHIFQAWKVMKNQANGCHIFDQCKSKPVRWDWLCLTGGA